MHCWCCVQDPETVVFNIVFNTVASDTNSGYLADINAGIDRSIQNFVNPVGVMTTAIQVCGIAARTAFSWPTHNNPPAQLQCDTVVPLSMYQHVKALVYDTASDVTDVKVARMRIMSGSGSGLADRPDSSPGSRLRRLCLSLCSRVASDRLTCHGL